MRHRVAGKQLGRGKSERDRLLKNLAANVILYERMKTTEARAKEVRKVVEKLITTGKKQNLASKRALNAALPGKNAAAKVQKELVPKYKDREGGYTRIVHMGARKADNARIVTIELV